MQVETKSEAQAYTALVAEWRDSLGLHDAGLSQLIGHHKGDWSRISRGLRSPSPRFHARVLAKADPRWQPRFRSAWRAYREALDRQIEGQAD